MDKETIFGIGKYIAFTLFVALCVWGLAKLVADSMSEYKVFTPANGVECVVVSRMFNTSVDCWKN